MSQWLVRFRRFLGRGRLDLLPQSAASDRFCTCRQCAHRARAVCPSGRRGVLFRSSDFRTFGFPRKVVKQFAQYRVRLLFSAMVDLPTEPFLNRQNQKQLQCFDSVFKPLWVQEDVNGSRLSLPGVEPLPDFFPSFPSRTILCIKSGGGLESRVLQSWPGIRQCAFSHQDPPNRSEF